MAGLCLCELFGWSRLFGVVFAAVLVHAACRSPMILLVDRITIEHGGDYGRRRVWGSVGFMLAAIAFGRWCPPDATRWLPGALAFTLAIAFVIMGIFRTVAALVLQFPQWGWALLNGVVTFLAGVIIYKSLPEGALWVIGLLIGLELLFNGWMWIMLGLSLRGLKQRTA